MKVASGKQNAPRILAITLVLLAWAAGSHAQTVIAQRACQGSYLGTPLQGIFIVERWMTQASYRYYGRFQDTYGNIVEFEVMSPYAGGTGGAWTNGMRHRETYITLQVQQNGFVIRTEDGITSQFTCQ